MNPTVLTPKQKSFLRSRAHTLRPVVLIGAAGLSKAVAREIEQAIAHHELIKIRLGGADREARQQLSDDICELTGASVVQTIGRMLVVYRPGKHPRLALP